MEDKVRTTAEDVDVDVAVAVAVALAVAVAVEVDVDVDGGGGLSVCPRTGVAWDTLSRVEDE
jgi:hypothetical protein